MKLFAGTLAVLWFLAGTAVRGRAADFAFGADFSYLKQAEDGGKVFKEGTNAAPALQLFRHHGYNWVRLRIFVEPVGERLPNNLAYTLALAQDAKRLGYKFLLDFHYASTWADPGKQPPPAQWEKLSHAERVEAVFGYTRDTLAAFRDAGVLPDMAQIGNEVTHGLLWPDGKLPDHWDNFAQYIYAGINGVDAGRGNGKRPKIMIHIDTGGSREQTRQFFDKLNTYDIPYDVIGFSYYPWWQGPLTDLRDNLAFTARAYGKDIIVVETAYYWHTNRETAARPGPFPETPDGQRQFLEALTRTVMAAPGGRGRGVFWWEPAVTGGLAGRGFFDNAGRALPVLGAFDPFTQPAPREK